MKKFMFWTPNHLVKCIVIIYIYLRTSKRRLEVVGEEGGEEGNEAWKAWKAPWPPVQSDVKRMRKLRRRLNHLGKCHPKLINGTQTKLKETKKSHSIIVILLKLLKIKLVNKYEQAMQGKLLAEANIL